MPIIQQITAQTSPGGLPPTRNATPADFGSGAAGAGLQDFGKAAQDSVSFLHERAVQTDVANVRVKMAEARAQWDVAFKEQATKAQPGEDFSGKFNQSFADYISNTRDIAQTQQGQRTFDVLAAELRGHYTEKAGLYQAQLAGVKAQQDWTTSLRAYGTSLQTDPSSYGSVLAQAMSDLRDPNGAYAKIDAGTRGKLEIQARNALAQNYVQGFINMQGRGPQLALDILNGGKLDTELDPTVKQTLLRQADQGIRRDVADREHQDALARKVEKDRIAKINDDLMGQFVQGKLTMTAVRDSGIPAFGEGSQATWISMMRQQAKEWQEKPIKTVPSVMVDAFERINLPVGDPRKITNINDLNKLYVQEKVSMADLTHLRKEFNDQLTDGGQRLGIVRQEFLKGIKSQLDKSTINSLDAGGGERYNNFTRYVNEQVEATRKAGGDPYELFNPQSSKYVGKAVATFQTGPQVVQRDLSNKINASLKPRQPGETPAQYLERTKKK